MVQAKARITVAAKPLNIPCKAFAERAGSAASHACHPIPDGSPISHGGNAGKGLLYLGKMFACDSYIHFNITL